MSNLKLTVSSEINLYDEKLGPFYNIIKQPYIISGKDNIPY